MRRTAAVTVALVVLALAAAPVAAQHGRGGRGGSGRSRKPAAEGAYGFTMSEVFDAVNRGEGRQALAWYEEVAASAERDGDTARAVRAWGAVTFAAGRTGQVQKAIAAGGRVLAHFEARPSAAPQDVAEQHSVYSVLSAAYRSIGDLAASRRMAEQGLAFAQASTRARGTPLRIAVMANHLASVLRREGDLPAALQRATEAADAAERFLTSPGRVPDRLQGVAHRQAAKGLTTAARVLVDLHRNDEAEAALGRATAHARLVGLAELEADITGLRGEIARARGDHAAALALVDAAIAGHGRVGRSPRLIGLEMDAAESLGALGRPDDALERVRRAMALVEDVRAELQDTDLRSGFLETKQKVYHVGTHLALRTGRVDEAFDISERGRARAFLDLLGNHATLSKGATKDLVAEETRLRADLAEARALAQDLDEGPAARPLIDAAEAAYRAFLARVRSVNLEQASLMAVEPVSAAEVRALLPAGTTLIEYQVGADDTIVWVLDAGGVRAARRLPIGRAGLVAEVRGLRAAITGQRPLAELEPPARALYDALVAPIRAEITTDHVLVVPHDVLHYVPFAALRTAAGRWLVEEVAISTLPSASVLKFLAGKGRRAGDRVVVLGNPDLGAGLELRWAEREARFIGQRYTRATVLVRDQATEATAKTLAGGAGILHFATHAELDESDPLASALLLVPSAGEDGRLEVRELFGLDLDTRLVVLSACETGLGKLSRGDELVGLQRGFLYAGTPAVVTTLWKVDDRASYELIRAFYERLDRVTAAEALREAQLATLRTFAHPFAWAGFVLTGLPR